jgi:hypothetical protein
MTQSTPALSVMGEKGKSIWLKPRRLLITAVIFHLVVTASVYGLGRLRVFPNAFDTYGIAVSFASDATDLREEAAQLGELLAHGQVSDWIRAASPLHIKLYSICFAFLQPWLGSNILSAEPLNALCYLAILVLVFKLSREIFSRPSALIAVAIVALWPSFLLHTTQLLKDPLFLVGMLAFIFVNLRLLAKDCSWSRALLTGLIGGLLAIFIWFARSSMAELPVAVSILAVVLLIVRQFLEKHFHAANLTALALVILLSICVTQFVPKFRRSHASRAMIATTARDSVSQKRAEGVLETVPIQTPSQNPLSRFAARVTTIRQRFLTEHPDAGSNIDSDVQLTSILAIIRYLPRAAAIGFLAPFPNMWLGTGNQVGSAGRLLGGLETMAMYLIEGLAIAGVWGGRRRFQLWLLVLVTAMGMITLGLVVINVGTLYRLRYVFLILLVVLAASGAANIADWLRKRR